MKEFIKHAGDVQSAVASGNFEQTAEGILLPKMKALVRGKYRHRVNGGEWAEDHNLVTTEGLNYILNVVIGATAKPAAWYVALFSGATAPAAGWTAASFAGVAAEIVSTTEGFSGANRPTYVPGVAAGGIVSNTASRASFTIATASSLNVRGAAILSSQTRGSTSGVLLSAATFATPRVFANGDIFDCEYELDLTAV